MSDDDDESLLSASEQFSSRNRDSTSSEQRSLNKTGSWKTWLDVSSLWGRKSKESVRTNGSEGRSRT